MKLFLSWSGDRSRGIAQTLKESLPLIMNAADPWMSDTDIEKGERWGQVLAGVLDQAKVGVFCLTASNMTRPALLFEAGAISKSVSEARVCVLLDGVKSQNLIWPWTQFQYTKLDDEKDMCKMLADINGWILDGGEPAVPRERFAAALNMWWPRLQTELKSIPSDSKASAPERSERDMLVELLELQRGQSRSFASLEESWRVQMSDVLLKTGEISARNAVLVAKNEILREESRRERIWIDALRRSRGTSTPAGEKAEAIREAVVAGLQKEGHETASALIATCEISVETGYCIFLVPVRRSMLSLLFNEQAERIAAVAVSGVDESIVGLKFIPDAQEN